MMVCDGFHSGLNPEHNIILLHQFCTTHCLPLFFFQLDIKVLKFSVAMAVVVAEFRVFKSLCLHPNYLLISFVIVNKIISTDNKQNIITYSSLLCNLSCSLLVQT